MPREAKSRRIEREYMADREFMTGFTAAEREFYILLSMFADDAGWLDWDAGELAGNMYRYEPLDARESKVSAFQEHLESTGRLRIYKCGHALMPRVAKRPRGMAREYAVQDAHKEHSKSTRVQSPPNLTVPNLTVPRPTEESINGRAPAKGAPVRGGTPKPLSELVGPLAPGIVAAGAKKS